MQLELSLKETFRQFMKLQSICYSTRQQHNDRQACLMNECLSNLLLSYITLTAPPPTIHSLFISSETSHHFLLTPLSAVEGVREHTLFLFLSHICFCFSTLNLSVRIKVGFSVHFSSKLLQ